MRTHTISALFFSIALLILLFNLMPAEVLSIHYWQLSAVGIFSILGMFRAASTQIISMRLIHWFFVFVFLFISPAARYITNSFPLTELSQDPAGVKTLTNWLIVSWCSLVTLGENYGRKSMVWLQINAIQAMPNLHLTTYLSLGAMGMLGLYILATTPLALLSRGGGISEAFSNNTFKLIFQYCARPFAVFLFFTASLRLKYTTRPTTESYVLALIAGGVMFLFNAPTATARFYAFAIYLSLGILFFQRYLPRKGYWSIPVLFLGIAIAEFIDQFRFYTGGALTGTRQQSGLEFWVSIQFDAYEMIAAAVQHVGDQGLLYGKNLLGALLFSCHALCGPVNPLALEPI